MAMATYHACYYRTPRELLSEHLFIANAILNDHKSGSALVHHRL